MGDNVGTSRASVETVETVESADLTVGDSSRWGRCTGVLALNPVSGVGY